ncbi:EpsG family protein [Collinsella tanakaei]|nr:EpsG family protein [Collinsella tanakaei]
MLVYLLQIGAIALFALVVKPSTAKRVNRTIYVCIIGAMLVAVSAVRSYTVGVDTEQFCRAYMRIGTEGAAAFGLERYEPLFTGLCLVLNSISKNYQLLIVASTALSTIPIVRLVYKRSQSIPFSLFLYITLNLYFNSMNIMRQAIAIGIIALAIPKLFKGKFLPFIVAVAIATLFHQSAPVALILIPLSKIEFKGRTFAVYLLAAVLIFIFSTPIVRVASSLLGRDVLYNDAFTGSNYFGALIQAAVALVCCGVTSNYLGISRRDGKEEQSDSLLQHAMMLWLLFSVFGMQVEIVGRLRFYFATFAILAIPAAISRAPKPDCRLLNLMTGAATLLYFLVIGIARPEWFGVIPYVADLGNVLSIF